MRKIVYLAIFGLVFIGLFGNNVSAQKSRASVSAAEATGTFKMEFTGKFKGSFNEIKILPLGKGKLKISFDLIYPYFIDDGEMSANLGQAEGIATIEGDEAVYASSEYGECRIIIKFVKPGIIKVTDENGTACGFGHNVYATGTYKRTSKLKPKFEDLDQ